MANYLFLLLVLACPLMMVWMMRGMHGSHGGDARGGQAEPNDGCGHEHSDTGAAPSLDELRRQRDELDHRIEEREAEEQTPVGGGRR